MKNKLFILIIFGIAVCFNSTLKAQTIPITTAGFSYVLTDPKFEQNVDYYDVWIFLYDPSINYWASYTEHIAALHAPGTYSYSGGPSSPFYMYQSNGYQVVLYVSKNDAPFGSGANRTGWSSVLAPDGNNVVHPGTIYVTSW